jgi:UDP-3-O-acyl-N-acetylglucosamine deacetylase
VALVRDQPNSASMGRRNRLNEFMPMDVMVTTPAQRSRTMLRESGISEAARLLQLCQINAKITIERGKKFAVAPKDWMKLTFRLTDSLVSAIKVSNRRRGI